MHRATWICGAAFLAGCLHEASTTCGNGGVCPPGLLCVDTGKTTTDGRICAAGTCGNARLDPGEVCDDGNNRSGDGCPADCTAPCGDGVLDPGEICDDGNIADGDGCAADCLSREDVFRVSPAMVSFTAGEGDVLPAAVSVTVSLAYAGDMALVGYVPGVPQPTWLSITAGRTTATTAEFELRVTDTAAVGPRSTTVRLLISHQNSTGLETFDLPVSYSVGPSDLAVEVVPPELAFAASTGDAAVPAQTADATFNGANVVLVSVPAWATVATPPAPVTSPAAFTVTINDTSFQAGTVLSDDIVFRTTRGVVQRTASVHLTYHVVAPPDLAIQASPASLEFTAVTGAAAPPSQAVAVTFSGADVFVVSAPPWLTVQITEPATSPAAFAVSVNDTSFAGDTTQSGDVVFCTRRGISQQTATVHVDYHVRPRPEVQFVAPYVGIAGRGHRLYVRGRGLASAGPVTVRIGDLDIGPVTPDGDTQVTVNYPALPEGRYPVTLVDPTAVDPAPPELVIVAPPAFGYQAIAASGRHTRIVFDAERQAIYSVDRLDQEIEHFVYRDHSWSALASHVIPQLTDIAPAPDGRSLIVLDRDAINEMSLTDGLFAPVLRVDNPDSFCGGYFDQAVPANNGKFFVVFDLSGCSGSTLSYFYDMRDRSLRSYVWLYAGHAGASGDGSRIYAGTSNTADKALIFDTRSSSGAWSTEDFSLGAVTVSEDASRVIFGFILGDTYVHDRSLARTGRLSDGGVALASRDSSKAFVYLEDAAGARLEVYDLQSPVQADGRYPLLRTITLPDAANGSPAYVPPVAMTSSLDDAMVFVAGDRKLLVVPVN